MPLYDLTDDEARILAGLAREDANARRGASGAEVAARAAQMHQLADRLRAPVTGVQTRTEYAREFVDPTPGDTPIPWDWMEFDGPPDLTKPPPPAGDHGTRWVARTITIGPWRPVEVGQ